MSLKVKVLLKLTLGTASTLFRLNLFPKPKWRRWRSNMLNEFAYFGGGCFWCTEAIFTRVRGVSTVTSGYAGGKRQDPNYEQVTTGATGHAEVVKVEFDPSVIS